MDHRLHGRRDAAAMLLAGKADLVVRCTDWSQADPWVRDTIESLAEALAVYRQCDAEVKEVEG